MNNAELSIAMLRDIEARLIELEKQWRHSDKRIVALESEFKDFSAWAFELLGPIGPPPRFDQRIAALEKQLAAITGEDVQMNVEHSNRLNEIAQRQELELRITALEKKLLEKITRHNERIAALETDKDYYFGLAGMFEELTKRIAEMDGTLSNLMVTAENLYRRIAALEANK